MNETRVLAEFLSALDFDVLPDDVVAIAKLCVLDTLGVAIAASGRPWARITADLVVEQQGAPESVLWGRAIEAPAQHVALANATAAHGIEMDDRHSDTMLHPGAMAIPAAAACVEKVGGDGRQFLVAVIAGYELGIRVGRAVAGKRRGMHVAGHKGVWCAVGAAGRAIGLDAERFRHAMGIAGSMAGAIAEFSQDPTGNMVKRLHGGMAASHGVLASSLAEKGLTGPGTVLEGRYGYCRVYCDVDEEPQFEQLTRDLGTPLRITEREIKPYAAWGGSHTAIDAAGQLLAEHRMAPGDIERLIIGGSTQMLVKHENPRPASIMAAQYSLPFVTALALCRGPAALMDPDGTWTDDTLIDAEVLRLSASTELVNDPELQAIHERTGNYGGVRVRAVLRDGNEREVAVYHSTGSRQRPATAADIKAKFTRLAHGALGDEGVQRVIDTVQHLDELDDVRQLSRLTAPTAPPTRA